MTKEQCELCARTLGDGRDSDKRTIVVDFRLIV